jgi:hypothetical protein
MATPQELADKIKQIEGTLNRLNAREQAYYQNILRDLKANTNELEKFETLFRDVVNAADDLNSELSFISKSFRDSVAELSKQNKELSNAKNALSSISKIAQEIVYENSQGVLIESKTLDKLEKKAKLQFQSLQIAIQSGRLKGNELTEAKASADEQQRFFNAIQGIREEQEKIKKNAGIRLFTGLEGISSAIPGLNKLTSAFQDASKASQETAIYNQKTFGSVKGITDEQKKEQNELNSKLKKYKQLRSEGLNINEALQQAGVSITQVKLGESNIKSITPMMAGIKSLGPALAKALGPLVLLKEFVAAFKLVDGLTGDLAKNMNMSYQDASAMSSELNSAANASGDIFVTTKGMQESLLAINKTLGTNVMLNKEDLATMTKFRTAAGLTNEELTGIYKLTLGTNKSLKDTTGEVLAQSKISSTRLGIALNEKEVLKEIKDVSAATTLSLGKNPKLIAEAVTVAKALGLEMSKLEAIAESLLNFQSSIESELEAELLTGRQLNLEQARYYALTNDVAGLAEEINKNLGSSAEFGKLNRLQQEAIAKSVGMNREELAKTLFIQDQLKGVSGEEAEKRKELLNSLTEQYGVEKAQQMLKEKSIEDLENQASVQDRFNASVEKLREIFVTVAESLMPVFDILSSAFSIVGLMLKPLGAINDLIKESTLGTIAFGAAFAILLGYQKKSFLIQQGTLALSKIKSIFQTKEIAQEGILSAAKSKNLFKTIGDAAMTAFKSVAGIPIVGPLLGAAAFASAAALGYKFFKGDDIVSPGYGKRTLFGPEGAIQLNDKDTVIAGTNLEGNKSKESSPSITNSINIEPLITELREVKIILSSILNKEGMVYIDGNLVGKTLALSQYRTGM